MKQFKRFIKVIAFLITVSITTLNVLPSVSLQTAQAATVKLNKKSITLAPGKTYTLSITGTKAKVTWSTSNKSVATVSTSGKVTAKKAGTATITAAVGSKKYTCRVTVKANPYVTNAPFKAQEAVFGKIKMVIPKDWTNEIATKEGNDIMAMLYPSSANMYDGTSNIVIVIKETGESAPDYDEVKEEYKNMFTADTLAAQYEGSFDKAEVTDLTMSDYETKMGTAFVISYNLNYSAGIITGSMYQANIELVIDNYLVQLTITDVGKVTPDIYDVADYIYESLEVIK